MLHKVSFIIPTLNRQRFVSRAVASCIAAGERADVAFEVIVLDSQSDDGSWESLNENFGTDDRVVLRQNKRGLGPTRSWLDGAELVTGTIVTFIWSDDYVADTMLVDLLPAMRANSDVAIGKAMIRDVEDNSPLPARSGRSTSLDPMEIVSAYYGVSRNVAWPPVSPACALFSRRAFDHWRTLVTDHADTNLLVQQLMWRRAIGPDMLLFLVALAMQQGPVSFVDRIVTQFSSHGDSISISSPQWLLRGGYLAARVLAFRYTTLLQSLPAERRTEMLVRTALQAFKLARGIPSDVRGLEDKTAVAAVTKSDARALIAMAAREAGWPATIAAVARISVAQIRKRMPADQISMAALA